MPVYLLELHMSRENAHIHWTFPSSHYIHFWAAASKGGLWFGVNCLFAHAFVWCDDLYHQYHFSRTFLPCLHQIFCFFWNFLFFSYFPIKQKLKKKNQSTKTKNKTHSFHPHRGVTPDSPGLPVCSWKHSSLLLLS